MSDRKAARRSARDRSFRPRTPGAGPLRRRAPAGKTVKAAAWTLPAVLALTATSVPASAAPRAAPAGTITTVAGGVGGPGPATDVALDFEGGEFSDAGHIIVADGPVREISERTDRLTTVAGYVPNGTSGDLSVKNRNGIPATSADMISTGGSVDPSGNLVISDYLYGTIQVAAARTGTYYGQRMTKGDIYTVAGVPGKSGSPVNGVPATKVPLYLPNVAVTDHAGNLVIADSGGGSGPPAFVQVVAGHTGTYYGQKMTKGDIYTVAGGGATTGNGGPAVDASLGSAIDNVLVDGAGNLVVSDSSDNSIRVIAATTGTFYGQKMTADHIYAVAGDGTAGFSGDGGPATSAELNSPAGVAVDGAGNLVIADTNNRRVRVAAVTGGTFYGQKMTAGDIYTVAGGGTGGVGGPALDARIRPFGVAVDGAGNLAVETATNERYFITGRGADVDIVAVRPGIFYRQKMAAEHIYTVAGNAYPGYSGDGHPATEAEFYLPYGVAVDHAGNVVTADTFNQRIRVAAAASGTFYGVPMKAGDEYTVAGNGRNGFFTGAGGLARKARLNFPSGVTVDHAGNILLTSGNRLLVVAGATGTFYGQKMTTGHLYLLAGNGKTPDTGNGGPATKAGLFNPLHIAVDHFGNVIVTTFNEVRMIAARTGTYYGVAMKAGDIYRVTGNDSLEGRGFSGDGGPARKAKINIPTGVAVDPAGNLVFSDTGNYRVRVVAAATGTFYGQKMTDGDIYTIAGDGSKKFSGDGGPPLEAGVQPLPLAIDSAGDILIGNGNRVRAIPARSGTLYGIPVTAGDIYTIAGGGKAGFSGDGGPALKARTNGPTALALDHAGNLYLADESNFRIRKITS